MTDNTRKRFLMEINRIRKTAGLSTINMLPTNAKKGDPTGCLIGLLLKASCFWDFESSLLIKTSPRIVDAISELGIGKKTSDCTAVIPKTNIICVFVWDWEHTR